jgi:hypothetical protein
MLKINHLLKENNYPLFFRFAKKIDKNDITISKVAVTANNGIENRIRVIPFHKPI